MKSDRMTYFVVLPFKAAEGRRRDLVADQPIEAPSAEAAKRRAQRIADAGGAALAFSRTGDPQAGDWNDAIVLGQFGTLPDGAIEAATEPV